MPIEERLKIGERESSPSLNQAKNLHYLDRFVQTARTMNFFLKSICEMTLCDRETGWVGDEKFLFFIHFHVYVRTIPSKLRITSSKKDNFTSRMEEGTNVSPHL